MANIQLQKISGHTFISNHLSKNSIVLDLGANAGIFSGSVNRRWGCTVHAVEPTPKLAERLKKIHGLTVHEAAVSGHGKDVPFLIDPLNSEASYMATNSNINTTLVRGTTLECLLATIGTIDLLKIDVEGAEIDILNSAPEFILRKIPQISVEFHDFKPDSGVTKKMVYDVFDRMRRLGFVVKVNSFWTNGDVLFINRKIIKITPISEMILSLRGRWIPGVLRVIRRLFR